ncbi:hypothetical protein M9194_03165 [Vibrio sp. S4M6]|uniref:PilN domain-containing protein n=1 Tax=Vibrio sinus TaxID=2946865 RepID=UPI00202A1097|nr:PilN domain-containing protein [Vibrio sinus]MCL9780431.1 hypothetical protein [Vibrio sinus]
MHKINLLPWREIRIQKTRQAVLVSLSMCVVFSAVLLLLAERRIQQQIDVQRERNGRLNTQIMHYSQQITSSNVVTSELQSLNADVVTMEKLLRQRYQAMVLMNVLANLAVRGVYIEKIIANHHELQVFGKTNDARNVSHAIETMLRSTYVINAQLRSIKQSVEMDSRHLSTFSISFHMNLDEQVIS